jgi:hypothetical protein
MCSVRQTVSDPLQLFSIIARSAIRITPVRTQFWSATATKRRILSVENIENV